MNTSPLKLILSPCRTFEARLAPSESSIWDRSHAHLSLKDLSFGSRVFGWHGVWSPCSRYFAIGEWLHLDSAHCPDMQLLVIDIREGRECIVEHLPCGFVEPMYFHDGQIRYSKIGGDMDARAVEHRPVGELTEWRTVWDLEPEKGAQSRRSP